MKKIVLAAVILIVAVVASCSVTQKKELDKKVKDFLEDFQIKLNGPEEDILKLFSTKQNQEEILKALAILQNKDTVVKVKILFEEATAGWEDSYLKVVVPIDLVRNGEEPQKDKISLKLFQRDGRYYIGLLDADEMYKHYSVLKMEDSNALARRMADVKVYYDRAHELQKNYDSVIWYSHHKNMTYYYILNGSFNFDSLKKEVKQNYKMGLLDETGKVIVPVEFELIGNPSMNLPEAVEVKKNGKIGYYTLEGQEIIPAVYEWLIPYPENETVALVKKDSLYGWLDKKYAFHQDFPSARAERSIREFSYLTENIFSFGGKYNDLIFTVYPISNSLVKGEMEFSVTGMVMPPSYLVKNGLFSSVDEGFVPDSLKGYQYGTDFVETKSQKPYSISEVFDAFISEFKTRYIGGRREFYTNHKIVLIDKKGNYVASTYYYGNEFKKLANDLFESKSTDFEEGTLGYLEFDFPYYTYYKFDGHQLTQLQSNRTFQTTQFIKLDSSYFRGTFGIWDRNSQKEGVSNFVSKETLNSMRDEILASYGFVFSDSEKNGWYRHLKKDMPSASSFEEVYGRASDIDKYNLDFLNSLIGSTPDGKSI